MVTNAQIKLLLEMIEWSWSGDPELVSARHWAAFNDAAEAVGYEVNE